jgi:hypothetical protein
LSNRILRHDDCREGNRVDILAVDIENNPVNGAFLCAGVFGKIKNRHVKWVNKKSKTFIEHLDVSEYFTDIEYFKEYLLSLNKGCCVLVFYNLSYDKVYLDGCIASPKIDKNGNKRQSVLLIGSRIISVTLKNGIKCLDLFNHTMMGSLENWIEYLDMTKKYGIYKAKLGDKTTLSGKYERVMNDAKATYYLGEFIQDFYLNECSVPLKLTVGANALKIFTTQYFNDIWIRTDDFYSNYERKAYYGGRVETFQRGELTAYSYDINSTYVSIMRDCLLPDCNTVRYASTNKNAKDDLGDDLNNHLSIIHCRVLVPDTLKIPVLPVRIDGKLKFPVGSFDGYWCGIELIEAIKQGCKILQIYDYVYYLNSKHYFREFAEWVWNKRVEYTQKGNVGMRDMVKRVGNALYGKFAERNGDEITCRVSEYPDKIVEGSDIFEYHGELWIRTKGKLSPSEHEFPCISAFITSYARIKLYKGIIANKESIIYCDTDCIKCTSPAKNIPIGDNLGEWKFEGRHDLIFYRSKFYGDKHKGVPKNAGIVCTMDKKQYYTHHKIPEFMQFSFETPIREKTAMRRNLTPNVWLTQVKTLMLADDKRVWHNKISYPIKYLDK